MDFGFTNEKARYEGAVAWRSAAILDGWELAPVYPDEADTSYGKLKKDGWLAHVCARTEEATGGGWDYQAAVTVWGPDGLQIDVPSEYPGFAQLRAKMRHCPCCGAQNVETFRVNFAGRVCQSCLPEARRQTEKPGWNS